MISLPGLANSIWKFRKKTEVEKLKLWLIDRKFYLALIKFTKGDIQIK